MYVLLHVAVLVLETTELDPGLMFDIGRFKFGLKCGPSGDGIPTTSFFITLPSPPYQDRILKI